MVVEKQPIGPNWAMIIIINCLMKLEIKNSYL